MRQPEGFVNAGEEELVCRLKRGLYGLKQSGRVWYNRLRGELMKIGFTPGEADSTVYFHFENEGSIQIVGWYVDDGLLAANNQDSIQKMISQIKNIFAIQDLGLPTRLLGIKIEHNADLGTIHISQPAFINTIAKQFGITPGLMQTLQEI